MLCKVGLLIYLPRSRELTEIDVRGTGILLGVDLISDIATDVEQKLILEHRIILRASVNKHCLLLTPPYVMMDEEFTTVAQKMKKVLSSWATLAESAMSKSRQW